MPIYAASAAGRTAPEVWGAAGTSTFYQNGEHIQLSTVCNNECIFDQLDAYAYFSINSNSAIKMTINVANIPFMSPMSQNSETNYTHSK